MKIPYKTLVEWYKSDVKLVKREGLFAVEETNTEEELVIFSYCDSIFLSTLLRRFLRKYIKQELAVMGTENTEDLPLRTKDPIDFRTRIFFKKGKKL